MSRKFIGLILATSMTITAIGAAPAHAGDQEDVAKFLGAAAALFIIGKTIDNHNKRDNQSRQQVHSQPKYKKPVPQARHYNNNHAPKATNRHQTKKKHPGKTYGKRHHKPQIPSQCLSRVNSNKTRYVVGQRCMNRNYQSARPFPSQCKMKIRTNNGAGKAYSVRCLLNRGYEIAHR